VNGKLLIDESIVESTWKGTYFGYFQKLIEVAGQQNWQSDPDLLAETLRAWKSNSRSRQIAHDRLRRLWKETGWGWPDAITPMRGNGKAAAPTEGVHAFTDKEFEELRARIERSKLRDSAALAWDLLAAFGIRPAELKDIWPTGKDCQIVATVQRKRTALGG